MNNSTDGGRAYTGRTRVIEIVGPAGAGKTTLYHALSCYNDLVRLENFPNVRKLADAPFFILNGLCLIPSLLQLYEPKSKQLTRREFAWMTILKGWPSLLSEQVMNTNKLIILDQGPIYLMAEMCLFGPEYLKQPSAENFWQDLFESWCATLDMVLYLDASDEILLNRIRAREQEHIVKDQPATVVYEFLTLYRCAYEYLLSMFMVKRPGLKVLQIDTGRSGSADIVRQLFSKAC
jgi:hypothetical protein